nr:polymorphic toxin type 44 domain-containing protein [Clostridium sp. DL-VIII]
MPNTLYLGRSGTFVVYGQIMCADDLGNLHYGYVGNAENFTVEFLSLAAGAANIRDNSKVSLPEALEEAQNQNAGPPGYCDKKGDNDWIREGYAWANSVW